MYCPKCGRELPAGSQFCPNCGTKVTESVKSTPPSNPSYTPQEAPPPQPAARTTGRSNPTKSEEGVCPKCGSHDCEIQVQQNVSSSGSNYSAGMGCLGYLLTGPFGLLCGLCGGGSKTTTTHNSMWVCKSCSYQYLPRASLVAKLQGFGTIAGMVLGLGVSSLASVVIVIIAMLVTGDGDIHDMIAANFGAIVFSAMAAGIYHLILKAMDTAAGQCGFRSAKAVFTAEEYAVYKKRLILGMLYFPAAGIALVLLIRLYVLLR